MEEIAEIVPEAPATLAEIRATAQDEMVVLFCSAKEGQSGDGYQMEIARGGDPFFILKAGQFKQMTRGKAQWHIGRSSKNDRSNPLVLSIKTMDEIGAMKAKVQADKAAQANALAQAAKDLAKAKAEEAARNQVEADTRLALVNAAIEAGVIESAEAAEGMTNDDLKLPKKRK
jgi:hypothetical protein